MRESLQIVLSDGALSLSGQVSAPWVVTGVRTTVAGSDPARSFVAEHQPAAGFSVALDVDLLWRSLGADTGSYDLFLEVTDGTRHESWPLGRFDETDRSEAIDPVPAGPTSAWVHLSEQGHFSLVLANEPPRRARAATAVLELGPHGIGLEQVLNTFSRPAESAVLSWTQRESGRRHESPVALTPRASDDGLFRYDLRGSIAPPAAHDGTGDDVHDPYVEVRLRGIADPVRVLIRPPAGRQGRRAMREIVLERGDDRQVFVPHLTFSGRRLAFWSETFSADAYQYMNRLRWISWSFFLVRPFLRIWLIGETPHKAQDNGFALFAWLRREHPRRRVYYLVEPDSPDRPKVEACGNVVLRHSRQHIWVTLLASRIIGTHHAEYLYASRARSFTRRVGGIRVFLQHGVTAMKNVTLHYGLRSMIEAPPDVFCVNAPAEQQIVVDALEYRPSQVPITGFTRFDALLTPDVEVEPRILVMPTWRDWLSDRRAFVGSEFVQQWTALLAGAASVAAERGMSVELILHANLRQHADLFEIDGVTVSEPGADLQALLKSSSLLVTDYSSVGWDFSFLDRPVVYFQFDRTQFISARQPPYIDYDSQLPGDIAATAPAAVEQITAALAEDGLRPDLRIRSRAFLQHADQGACQRTFDVVRRADGPGPRLLRLRTALLRGNVDARVRRQAGRARRWGSRIIRRLTGAVRSVPATTGVAAFRARIEAVAREPVTAWPPLQEQVAAATAELSEEDWARLPLHDRIAAWLTVHDRRSDLVTALVHTNRHGPSFLSVRDDPDGVARPGYLDSLEGEVPTWLLRPADGDLPVHVDVDQITTSSRLHLHGAAYVRGMRFDSAHDSIDLTIVEGGVRRHVPLDRGVDALIDTTSGDRWCSYAEAGWRAVVEPLPARGARLEVAVTSGGVTRQAQIALIEPPDSLAVLTSVQSEGDTLQIGIADLPGGASVATTGRLRELDVTAHRGHVELSLTTPDGLAVDTGRYEVRVLDPDGNPHRLAVGDDLASVLPIDGMGVSVAWRLGVRDGQVELTVRAPHRVEERGRLNQRLLLDEVRANAGDVAPGIVATCFSGRATGDSVEPVARELADRLDWPVRWCVADHAVATPDGTEPLLIHSRAWHEALATSRLLINNAHFPAYFTKRPGQVYLQTWHGTPLKRIGQDIPGEAQSLSYRDLMVHEAAAWDLLLAQNDFAADVLPGAFGFPGPVLASGYPRNDALVAPDVDGRRQGVRTSLGIGAHQTAVLYAPTWRDGAVTDAKRLALVSHLDPLRLRALLGDEVVVMLRGHSNTARGRSAARDVVDVTDHHDLPGLFLAADVLVTDYSSVMFDFCVTGRPMIFLAPDLAQYRDSTRGFYLDLEEIAPGPVVTTTDEVAAHLADLDASVAQHAERYAAFVARFAPLDDGHAAHRVADQVIEMLNGVTALETRPGAGGA